MTLTVDVPALVSLEAGHLPTVLDADGYAHLRELPERTRIAIEQYLLFRLQALLFSGATVPLTVPPVFLAAERDITHAARGLNDVLRTLGFVRAQVDAAAARAEAPA